MKIYLFITKIFKHNDGSNNGSTDGSNHYRGFTPETSNFVETKTNNTNNTTNKTTNNTTNNTNSTTNNTTNNSTNIYPSKKEHTKHVLTTYKRKKDLIPKKVRDGTWIKYHGNANVGICYCCGTTIQRYNRGWHCSHVLADSKGGEETIENMRTCCAKCNLSMGNCNLYVYIRDKKLTGPGAQNIESYFIINITQINDRRS
jgi:hypothetical protein